MDERQQISLKDIPLRLQVGVPEAERATAQALRADITLEILDPPGFADRDTLDQTIDYDAILHFLREGLGAHGPFALIETIADRICAFCLSLGARVHCVEVRISKPSVLPAAQGLVSVALRRVREGARGTQKAGSSFGRSLRSGDHP